MNLSVPAGPGPGTSSTCPPDSDLCTYLYQQIGVPWLATGGYYLLVKPLRILLIAVLAVIARYLVHRMINRLVRHTTAERETRLPHPLRQRLPTAIREVTGLVSERRRQRAEALGSALLSAASGMIFAIAVMLVLAELGINLAPLLASAGIAGIAIGFGAQNLVKDFLSGMFTLMEDQFGVGDVVDIGDISGTVEAVGLRITMIRDAQGVVWYIRNGEIVRVGNRSQGWAMVTVDIPVELAGVNETIEALHAAAAGLAGDPRWDKDLVEAPEVLGLEEITANGAVLRTVVRTTSEARARVARELRRRLTEALERTGTTADTTTGTRTGQ